MSEFIKVTKNGEVIEVHPDVLANHLQLGWVVVEEFAVEPVAVETPEPAKPSPLPPVSEGEGKTKKKVVSRV